MARLGSPPQLASMTETSTSNGGEHLTMTPGLNPSIVEPPSATIAAIRTVIGRTTNRVCGVDMRKPYVPILGLTPLPVVLPGVDHAEAVALRVGEDDVVGIRWPLVPVDFRGAQG